MDQMGNKRMPKIFLWENEVKEETWKTKEETDASLERGLKTMESQKRW